MRIFFDQRQADHAPLRELNNGEWMPYAESADRVHSIAHECGDPQPARDFGIDPILAVHDADYVAFLRTAHERWRAAGRDYMGGYCYLNNAAIAAQRADALGLGPVAILDVDYHHGNGTQDIFLGDPTVFFASIHADPATDYPFYWGHADERGEGAGTGTTLNLPLPRGSEWAAYSPALERALEAIGAWGAKFLIVSFGADTFAGDPISHFALTRSDFAVLGSAIAGYGLPTLVVMEGGYAVDELGRNVAAFLGPFG